MQDQREEYMTTETLREGAAEPGNTTANIPKKGKKKIILIIIIALLLVLAAFRLVSALRPAEVAEIPPVNVTITQVERSSVYAAAPLTGRVQSVNEAAIVPLVSGEVTAVNVELGDYVEKGTVLFTIDRTQMNASYNQALSGRAQAQAAVTQATGSLESVKKAYEGMQALYEQGAVSQKDYEDTLHGYEAAEQGLAAARAALAAANAGLSSASEGLSYCAPKAPISGYVTSVNVSVGGLASQAAPAVTLADTSELEINTTVSEYLISKLAQGDSVEITVSVLPGQSFSGLVKALSPAPSLGTLTYPATISIDDPENLIRAGMFAEIQIVADKRDSVLCLPSAAVFIKAGQSTVATLDADGLPSLRQVTTGLDNGETVEIVDGLKEGETVIITGQQYITEGVAVNVLGQ